jgi:hypothetical protein
VNIVQFAVGACETSGANLSLALQPVIAQGAAEGISYESVASGGANLCGLGTVGLPMTPANLDTVTAVGGSSTFVRTSGNQLAQSALSASNGGVCLVIGLPAWQAGTPGVVTTGRNVPDVVIPGSVDGVGPSIYFGGAWQGGSQFVNNAPFAGYLATVQEKYGYTTEIGNIAPRCMQRSIRTATGAAARTTSSTLHWVASAPSIDFRSARKRTTTWLPASARSAMVSRWRWFRAGEAPSHSARSHRQASSQVFAAEAGLRGRPSRG